MELASARDAVATIVRVRGEIDVASAPGLEALLTGTATAERGPLIVSLERCSYFDSSGLHVLIRTRRSIGRRLRVVVPANAPIRRIFDISGLCDVLDVVPTVPQALESVA